MGFEESKRTILGQITPTVGRETTNGQLDVLAAPYSATEHKTGRKWLDGSDVYEVVVPIPAGPSGPPATYAVAFTTFAKLISMRGALQNGLGDFLPLPFQEETMANDAPDGISAKLISSDPPNPPDSIQLTPPSGTDYSGFSGHVILEYTKVYTGMVQFPVDIVIDPAKAKRGLDEVEKGLHGLENSADRLRSTIQRTFAFVGISFGVREILGLANTYQALQNRLRVVTGSTEELADVTNQLFELAGKTRAEFASVAELYARLSLSTKQLGLTQQELLHFTEQVNQAIALSGASATEASAGFIQLSQGLASGALRGDELRSVLEQLPAVANVIAKGLGVTIGQLRVLGGEGKLTAEAVIGAFKKAGGSLQDDFAKTVPTLSQAMVGLNNETLRFVGEADKMVGATTKLGAVVAFASEHVGALSVGVAALATASAVGLAGRALPAVISGLTTLRTIALTNPFVLLATGITAAVVALREFNDVLDETNKSNKLVETGTLTEFGKLGDRIVNARSQIERLNKTLATNPQNDTARRLFKQAQEDLDGLTGASKRQADQYVKTHQAQAKVNKTYDELLAHMREEGKLLELTGRERDVQEQLLKAVETVQKGGGGINDKLRAELETQIRLNSTLGDQQKALEEIRGPNEDYQRGVDALNALLKAGTINANEYTASLSKLQGISADIGPSTAPGFQQTPLVEDFSGSHEAGQQPGSVPFGSVANTREQLDLLAQINSQQAEYNTKIADLTALRNTDSISVEQYRRLVDEATLQQLQGVTTLEAGYHRFFTRIRLEAQDSGKLIEETFDRVFSAAEDALVTFAEGGTVKFNDLANSVVKDLLRIYAHMLLVQALNAISPGSETAASAAGAALTARAEGGTVQPGRAYLVGEHGPEPFYPDRTGTIAPTAGSAKPANVNVSVVNVTDPKMVAAAIGSGDADQVIINVLARNSQKANRALGTS